MALDVLGLSGFVGGRAIAHMGLPEIPWASPRPVPVPELVSTWFHLEHSWATNFPFKQLRQIPRPKKNSHCALAYFS
jgi:hypothetical protein